MGLALGIISALLVWAPATAADGPPPVAEDAAHSGDSGEGPRTEAQPPPAGPSSESPGHAPYEEIARAKGFLMVAASPLTRSSHHAGEDFARLQAARRAREAAS